MGWPLTPAVVLLLIAAAVSVALGAFALRHHSVPAAGSFLLLMAASAAWSLTYAVYLASDTLEGKRFWAGAVQGAAIVVPVAWALLVLRYAGWERWLRPRPLALLLAVPAFTLLLVLTNPLHGWFWSRFVLVRRGAGLVADVAGAWGFWLHIAYSWALLLLCVLLLLQRALGSTSVFRAQAVSLFMAALVPFVANVLHWTHLLHLPANPMPFLFTLSGAVFAWAIFRYRFLNLLPVARERLVEEMRDAVIVLDDAGRMVDVNRAATRLLGATAETLLGRALSEVAPRLAALIEEGDAPRGRAREFRLREGDDDAPLLQPSSTTLTDERGRRTGTLLLLRDVTEHRAAEAAHALSRAYLEQLFDSAGDGIVLVDAHGRVLAVNDAFRRIFGFDTEAARGRHVNELIAPEPLREEAAELTRRLLTGERVETETRRQRRDGTLIDVALSATPVYVDGRHIATFGIYRDVTERRRTEVERIELLARERAARAEAEAATRRARFSADVGALLSESLDYEAAYAHLARMAIPELADYCLIDEVTEDGGTRRIAQAHVDPVQERMLVADHRNTPDVDPERSPVIQVLRTGKAVLVRDVTAAVLDRIALDETHRAGLARLGLRSYIVVPLVARGRTLGTLSLLSSVSGRLFGPPDLEIAEELARRAALALDNARLYGEARQAVRARDNVLGVVSHDMRNPLAAVLLNTTSLLDGPACARLHESEREQLRWVVRSVEQLEVMIEDLLAITQIEAGQLPLDVQPTPAAVLPHDALEMFAPLARERGIALHTDAGAAEAAGWVRADRYRISRVFGNLIGNALKFTASGGAIHIETAASGAEVRFTVRDTGCGIPPDQIPHVFERFWRGGARARDGAGLGLPIARAIVEAHGGHIGIESREGEGTVVWFTLPAAEPPAPAYGAEWEHRAGMAA